MAIRRTEANKEYYISEVKRYKKMWENAEDHIEVLRAEIDKLKAQIEELKNKN